jgi:hypothetical protein
MSTAPLFNGDYWATDYFDGGYWGTGQAVTPWRGPGRRHRLGAKDHRKSGPEPDFADEAYWKTVAKRRQLAEDIRKAEERGAAEKRQEMAKIAAIDPQEDEDDVAYLMSQADAEERSMIARFIAMIMGARR